MLLPLQGPPLDAMQERAARTSQPHLPTQGRGLSTRVSRPSPLVSAMLVQELLGEASALGSLLEEVVGREASFLGRRSRLASSHRVTRTRTTGSSGLLQRARVPHLRAGLEAAAAPPRHPLQPHPAAVRRLCRAAGDPTTTTTTTTTTAPHDAFLACGPQDVDAEMGPTIYLPGTHTEALARQGRPPNPALLLQASRFSSRRRSTPPSTAATSRWEETRWGGAPATQVGEGSVARWLTWLR